MSITRDPFQPKIPRPYAANIGSVHPSLAALLYPMWNTLFQHRQRNRFMPPLQTRLVVYNCESAPNNYIAGSRIFQTQGITVHGIGNAYLLPICKRTFFPPRYAINSHVHTQPGRSTKGPMCTNASTLRSIPPSLYRRPSSTATYGRGCHRR